jgi:hypothetical protein
MNTILVLNDEEVELVMVSLITPEIKKRLDLARKLKMAHSESHGEHLPKKNDD